MFCTYAIAFASQHARLRKLLHRYRTQKLWRSGATGGVHGAQCMRTGRGRQQRGRRRAKRTSWAGGQAPASAGASPATSLRSLLQIVLEDMRGGRIAYLRKIHISGKPQTVHESSVRVMGLLDRTCLDRGRGRKSKARWRFSVAGPRRCWRRCVRVRGAGS